MGPRHSRKTISSHPKEKEMGHGRPKISRGVTKEKGRARSLGPQKRWVGGVGGDLGSSPLADGD